MSDSAENDAALARVEEVLRRLEREANSNFHHKTGTLRVVSDLRHAIKGTRPIPPADGGTDG